MLTVPELAATSSMRPLPGMTLLAPLVMGIDVSRYTPCETCGSTKVSISPLLACACTVMLGAVRSGSRTSIWPLRLLEIGVQTGGADCKVTTFWHTVPLDELAVKLLDITAPATPTPCKVTGTVTVTELPAGPLTKTGVGTIEKVNKLLNAAAVTEPAVQVGKIARGAVTVDAKAPGALIVH